jgi:hypothetical protein
MRIGPAISAALLVAVLAVPAPLPAQDAEPADPFAPETQGPAGAPVGEGGSLPTPAALDAPAGEQAPRPRPATGNQLENFGFERERDGGPGGWEFRAFSAETAPVRGVRAAGEGRNGTAAVRLSAEKAGHGAFSAKLELEPSSDYLFGGWVRAAGLKPEGDARGAQIRVRDEDRSFEATSDFIRGDREWVMVQGRFRTGAKGEVRVYCELGAGGGAAGSAWFDDLFVVSGSEPYRRPVLEPPMFDRENLSLDKDQVAWLASALTALACNFPSNEATQAPAFQSGALGLALTLDPRYRDAVVANGNLDAGQALRPVEGFSDLKDLLGRLDRLSPLLNGDDATSDDRALGVYLADLVWQLAPDLGWGAEYAAWRENGRGADWSPLVPPPPPPMIEAQSPEVAALAPDDPSTGAADPGTPSTVAGAEPAAKIRVGSAFAQNEATTLTVALAGGRGSRAAARPVRLSFRDYSLESWWDDRGQRQVRRVPLQHEGPARLVFSERNGSVLRDVWEGRTSNVFRNRFSGWPSRGEVDVIISGYSNTAGSSAALAVAVACESMVRGVPVSPRVAMVATWNDEGRFTDHSHLPGILAGYGKDWSDILLTGPGGGERLVEFAKRGYVTPLLSTQIIEVSSYDEAFRIAASAAPPAEMRATADEVAKVLALRGKMKPGDLVRNPYVLEKLKQAAAASPRHLNARLLLVAAENQQPLNSVATFTEMQLLFSPLEHMAQNDLAWVSEAEGMETIEIFNERLREVRPRMSSALNRFNIRLDEAIRAITEVIRQRDRNSVTMERRIERAGELMRVIGAEITAQTMPEEEP